MRRLGLALLVLAMITGCSSSSDDGSSTTAGTTATDGTTGVDGGDATDTGTSGAPAPSGTTHEVTSSDGVMDFSPEDITIAVGDTINFVMSATHNAIEVSKDTYDNRGVTALDGGFQVTFGETKQVTFTEPGVHYYVCTPHVTIDMIGTITVQ